MAVANDQSFAVEPDQLTAIERLPGVRESVRGIIEYAHLGVGVAFFAPVDGRVGTTSIGTSSVSIRPSRSERSDDAA